MDPGDDGLRLCPRALGIEGRVHLPGFLPEPHRYVGLLDIFALSSDTEQQFPISLIEVMAARLPSVCTGGGDIPDIVARENAPFIVAPHDEAAFAASLRKLLLDEPLRRALGAANRARVEREFSLALMEYSYDRRYRSAIEGGSR